MHTSTPRMRAAVTAEHQLPSRRLAWTIFGVLVLLMVVDYVDRQVIVSMFPHLKAQWSSPTTQLGSLVSIVSIVVALGTVPLSLLADRWSRVKSIVADGGGLELRDDRVRLRAQLRDTCSWRAGFVGLGEAAYGSAGAALLASIFPARLRSTVLGAFLGAGLVGLGARRRDWVASSPSTGDGVRASASSVFRDSLLAMLRAGLSCATKRACAAPAHARPASDRAARASRRGAAASAHRHLSPASAQGLQLLVVSTIWAWTPSFFNRYYGLAPDQAGYQDRTGRAAGQRRFGRLEPARRSAGAARPVARACTCRSPPPCSRRVFMCSAFGALRARARRSSR